MTRNRFEEIKRFLYFTDNGCLPEGDKMPKIHSLQEAVNASLQQFGVFVEDLSVDEHILEVIYVKYLLAVNRFVSVIKTGHSHQAVPLNYINQLKFETYVGASEMRQNQSLDSCIVLNLLLIIENPRQHCACFYDFFTSY